MGGQRMQPNLGDILRRLEACYPPAKGIMESKGCMVKGDSTVTLEQLQSLLLHPELTLVLATMIKPNLLPIVVCIVDEAFLHNGNACGQGPAGIGIALIKLLHLAPHLEGEVRRFFSRFSGPFHYISSLPPTIAPVEAARITLLGLQACSYLRNMWSWPSFLPMLQHQDLGVKWCGVQCLGVVTGAGDTLTASLLEQLMTSEDAVKVSLDWQDVCTTIALHRSITSDAELVSTGEDAPIFSEEESHMDSDKGSKIVVPSGYVDLCGILLPRRTNNQDIDLQRETFVLTSTMERGLRSVALALSCGEALLIEGPPSCGKSALITHVAAETGNLLDMVRVHLDEQTDTKTLVGSYVCTEKPGEFVWQPGPVTLAVTQGSWLVFENLNMASAEVLGMLIPLAERRKLHIPSRSEDLIAASGFQFIATVTTDPGLLGTGAYGSSTVIKDLMGSLLHIVRINESSFQEKREIIEELYPHTAPLCLYAIKGLDIMHGSRQHHRKDHTMLSPQPFSGTSGSAVVVTNPPLGRYFCFRDLIKWSRRMATIHSDLIARALSPILKAGHVHLGDIPIDVRLAALIETIDCFCAGISKEETFDLVLEAMAANWSVPMSTIHPLVHLAKPDIKTIGNSLSVGRVVLPRLNNADAYKQKRSFVFTGHASRMMERVVAASSMGEPVLLVGETGTGKTSLVQELASQLGAKLVVINVSRQTDASDLIGGYRPIRPQDSFIGLLNRFTELVRDTWKRGNNDIFIEKVTKLASKARWQQLMIVFRNAIDKVSGDHDTLKSREEDMPSKRQRRLRNSIDISMDIQTQWQNFSRDCDSAESIAAAAQAGFAFGFFEGALVQAVKLGWWLLLDEINLAPPETLERINGLLETNGSISVIERGDKDVLDRHPDFRLFAAMNPSTDAGKRELPATFRGRFTELWVGEAAQRNDLASIVAGQLRSTFVKPPIEDIVDFYLAARKAGDTTLKDGGGHKPAYNLRTLSRALEYAVAKGREYGMHQALYDGFAMSFLTQLDTTSARTMEALLRKHLLGGHSSIALKTPPAPQQNHVLFDGYWVELGNEPQKDEEGLRFIRTGTVNQHLRNLARAVLLRRYPILLQGPTSSGKTSLVAFLAARTGHRFIRINNHEQTDLQEYLGSYIADEHGRLTFQEGILVQAVRYGYWVVLDELNLAPTEVLEALNRLLDDNRELFVPDLREVIKPHPHFMLFATQNPPGIYAGRKTLSRAFRSRFIELHVDDIPDGELHTILEKRCEIAPSQAEKLILVMRELQRRRSMSNVFAGRHGYITPRDLFRWANRGARGYQDLAVNGFELLGERLRTEEERATVFEVVEKLLRVKIDLKSMYAEVNFSSIEGLDFKSEGIGKLVWTTTLRRMYSLLARCLQSEEPALLIGETGLGKTSVCQILAKIRGQKLRIINCNHHTESSDFLGGYRPNRSRRDAYDDLKRTMKLFIQFSAKHGLEAFEGGSGTDLRTLQLIIAEAARIAEGAPEKIKTEAKKMAATMAKCLAKYRALFEWVDGPLTLAMKEGDIILIDELNLAEDAVLERLNSVLEPSRTLTLAEKGGREPEVIVAHPSFRLIGTMNPGGDFGKKELSPALSNRFTSIWVPPIDDVSEMKSILKSRLEEAAHLAVPLITDFVSFYKDKLAQYCRQRISLRDLLTWVEFVNAMTPALGPLLAYTHGACVTLLDGIGLGLGLSEPALKEVRSECERFLRKQLPPALQNAFPFSSNDAINAVERSESQWGINPFFLECDVTNERVAFEFNSPTTSFNLYKILRAMQIRKPVLLEGSPGVGKTSLLCAMAKALGRKFFRINLSEQTDMMDLLGADLPVQGAAAGEFAWSDGPLLQAIKLGGWVLLDELNLANQTILEGLNALLDHRSEVFIPELGKTFKCGRGFRIFGSQNPLREGGGRKGLPKSFLNRFTRVYVEQLEIRDMLSISGSLYRNIPSNLIKSMVEFLQDLQVISVNPSSCFLGGPWDFNLRDLLRWCQMVVVHESELWSPKFLASHFADTLFLRRLRCERDHRTVRDLLKTHGFLEKQEHGKGFYVDDKIITVGLLSIDRHKTFSDLRDFSIFVPSMSELMEALAHCISQKLMGILVGPSNAGKTTLVRSFARLNNQELLELSLNAGTDATDLLGGFEQVDLVRRRRILVESIDDLLSSMLFSCSSSAKCDESLYKVGALASRWSRLRADVSTVTKALGTTFLKDAEKIISEIGMGGVDDCLKRAWSDADFLEPIGNLEGKFEWVDSSFTRAVSEGRWVLINNANLCNPTILDRLNSLMESDGSLCLNECGMTEEGFRVINPHPNFRLFLAYNPRYGEVSRAMRNRGIEIYFMPGSISGLASEVSGERARSELVDIVNAQGINGRVASLFVTSHEEQRARATKLQRRAPSVRELKRWSRMTLDLFYRGFTLSYAVQEAFFQVYLPSSGWTGEEGLSTITRNWDRWPAESEPVGTWYRPISWPIPLSTNLITFESSRAFWLRDMGPMFRMIGRACERIPGDDFPGRLKQLLGFDWVQFSFASIIMLPGDYLSRFLCGSMASSTSRMVEGSIPYFQLNLKAIEVALHVFLEGTQVDHKQVEYLLHLLQRCLNFCRRLGLSDSGHIALLDTHLHHCMRLAQTYCNIPVLGHLNSRMRFVVKQGIGLKLVMDRMKEEMVEVGPATILQLSCWRFHNVVSRNRFPVVHAVIDALWPFFVAALGLQGEFLSCCSSMLEFDSEKWVVFNEELNYLYHLTHRDPVFSKIERCDEALENVGFAWLSTRKVAKELLDSLEALNDKREPLRQAVYAVDASLGIADEDSLKDWFFWRLAGHPSVPADEEMFQSLASIAALCRSITQGAKGVASLHDLCKNCPNQAIAWDKLTKDVDCQLLEDMGEYIIAALSSNTKLRHEVLHGLALLWTACTTPALPRDITTSSISNELWDATARLLEAGQTAWYLQGDGTQSEPGFLLGKTDLYLPTNMLTRNSNRSIQTSLYAFSDAPLSRKQLVMLAGMDCPLLAMLSLGIDHSQPEVTRLQFLADCIGATPSRDIREAIPYLLLSWLGTDTSRSSVSEIPPESRNVIRQSLVHDAWFNWLRGLWSLGPSTLANRSVREARLTPDAPISRGPCLLHLCSSTSQLCSILQDSSAVPIAESLGHYLRLQLVARHLRELTTSPDQNYKSVTVAEWKAATLIAGSTVHSLLAEQLGSDTSDGIVCLLIRAKYPGDISSSQIWEKVSLALGASNHRNLWRAELTILPALQLLQYPSVTEATNVGMNLRGRVYILLGLSRLQMSVPPPGSDPAKVYKLQEQRLLHEVEWDVDLQLQVREEYEMVPGGPPQSSLVKNLLERRDTLLREATNLAGKSPWRPTPPQYLSLRSEIARFQANFADNDRLLLLVERLLASDRAAIEEAKAWMSTAEAMVDHLTREYPAYRDISQPFQLALEEMRYGFSLLITSLELEDVADLRAIEGLVADLLAFPHRKSKVGIITDISRAKHLAAKLIQQQTDKTQKETGVDYDTNTIKLQLELLRNFLWRMIQGWRYARTKPSQSELVSGFQHICCILLEYWEIAKVEEAKRAEEEAQLFKEKRRTETSDDEIDISILRENFSTFAEFIEDGDTVMEGDVGGQERDAKVSKAVYSAIDYITGDIIKDVIAIQSEMFDDQKVFADNMFTGSFLRSHNLGLAMVEFAGHRLTTCLDSMSNTGHLYATCLRGLSLMSSGTSSDRTSEEEGDLDIWVENPSEARLLTDVLGPLKKRVADLLAEWPDHPVLSQINAIITRLLSMSMRSPLKGLLTGIEILLSKAQLWEETAARHVSLQKQLKDVSGLSRRWRRLELNGWRTILRKTMGRVAEGAYSGWFHLFRILFNESEVSLESTALAVEEFIKLSPIGEYGTRINMVKVFQGHLKAVHEADEARKDRSTALASMLFNLTLYYGQFLPFVQKTIQSAIVPIEKELEDFVALAKWEDRGYYALQLSSEKAHKHLQKLKRKVADVLRQPVSNAIGEAAKLMGLDDLTLADSRSVSHRKSGEHSSSCVAAADILTNVDSFMLHSVEARTDKPDKHLPDNRLGPGKYTKNIPNLLGRFHKLALDGLQASAESCRRAVGSANDLASEAVERALILQKDVEKGAKARKKKALVDFLKALGDLGVSRLRTAVPINYRGPNAWLFLAAPDVGVSPTIQESERTIFMESWSKAESCYILSLARLQRLQEAAARPHQDIRPSEAEVACRLSEHLLYLVQRGREALSNFSMEMRELSAVIRLLDDLSTDSTINQQDASELSKKLEISSHLVRLTRETEELLSAAGRFEPYSENSKFLSSASSAARAMWIKLESCVSDVISTSSNSVCLDANRREIFVTPSMHESLNALGGMIKELSNEVCDSEHQKVPGWTELGNAFSSAVSAYQEINRHRHLVIDNDQCSIASDIESMVEACLLWVQNECFLSKRDETSELSRHTEDCREVVLSFMNALRRSNAKGLKLVNDRAGISINKLAGLSSSQNDACIRSNAQLLMSTRVLLKVLLSASWSAGCHLMALHRSIAKLTYITCGILATVVQDGFCMPEEEGEEVTEGEVKEMHGTGLADGDTRGAKDISDEIEDEDQVLGAQQKGQEKEEHPQPEQQDEKDASRGIEMEDDFEGGLEDVKQDLDNDQDDSLDEEDGDAERLDQQMGDVGEEGLEVDERLWNEEDGGADRQEEKYDQKQTLEVKDTSDMEYAQGQEKQEAAEDDRKKSTEVEKEERRVEDAFDEDGLGDNGEENETMEGQTEEGRTQLEQPDAELQIPENWDLDDGEADEEEVGEQGEDEKELLEELQLGEDGKKEDEKPDFPEDNGEGGDSEMQQPQDMEHNNENEETEGFGGQNTMPFDGTDEVEDKEEDKENDADLKVQDKQEGASEVLEDALQGGDHGQNAPNKGQMPVDGLQNNEDENQAYADDKEAAIASTGGETTGPGGGLADLMTNDQSNYQDRKHSQGPQQQDAGLSREQANPLRNLGSAIQEWRKRLALLADLNGEQKHDDAVDLGNEADTPEGETAEGAYRFLGEDETPTMGKDTQVLAQATDEQIDTQMAEGDVAVIDDEDAEMDEYNEPQAKEDMATQPTGSEAKETVDGSRGDKKTKLHGEAPVIEEPGSGDEGMQGKELTDTDVEKNPTTDVGLESLISTKFQATHIDDDDILDLKETMLPMERAAALREELMKRLEAVQVSAPSAGDEDYGRQAWERCEMLTSSLVGELTEQLRLILEPTIASKMGGEFRTGKRINMKRVIAYIASQFRKDKIWMRRSHPDKRRYQVLIAVDNSRSMAETGCGPFALEAVTLIARAMSRLEVGELGVVSFGGPGGAQPLHNFDENFSEADGIRIMSSLRFNQDNTIKDRPMEDVILSIDALLENASLRFSSMSGGTGSLHQLVLIVADGRFHEKESLQLAVRNASERPGVLYAFLVLDNSVNSVLDMQSVAFENGKPVFTKYIDSFPFPYYIVLRNTAALPRTLADLLRQWFEMQQG